MFKKLVKKIKSIRKTIKRKETKVIEKKKDDVRKPELRVLWVSRHNMALEGYITLKKLYKDYNVCVYPCQPRVLEGRQILELAQKYNCTVVCAILSDRIFDDLVSDKVRIKDYTILRPELKVIETKQNYSPLKTLKIYTQKEYEFEYWEDMKTGMKIKLNNIS